MEDAVLEWLESYLENGFYHTIMNETKSVNKLLQRGLPQGSVLRPILFPIHTTELSRLLQHERVKLNMFADDTQFDFAISE